MISNQNQILQNIEKHFKIYVLIIAFLASFNLFINLGSQPVLDWDEARHGITAYEMVKSNNWILTTYQNNTDYWNLKPPLGIWLIGLSYKLFGFNSFALRFPSALSALICILLTVYLAGRKFDKQTAVLSGLILSTSFVFLEVHSARTGDMDAQLTLLILLTVLFLEKMKINNSYIYPVLLIASMAFLLKSFAFIIIIGIILADFLFYKEFKKIKLHQYIISLIIFILPVAAWAIARYFQDGAVFFNKMFSYDLINRGTNALEGHSSSNFSYLEPLLLKFLPWSILLILFLFYKNKFSSETSDVSGSRSLPRGYKDVTLVKFQINPFYKNYLFIIWMVIPLLTVFVIKTKCEWYLDPIYPPIAIFIGWHLTDLLKTDFIKKNMFYLIKTNFIKIIICFIIIAETAIIIVNFSPIAGLLLNKKSTLSALKEEIDLEDILKNLPGKKLSLIRGIDALEWAPSKIFIAEVEKGLIPAVINNYTNFLNGSNNKILILKTALWKGISLKKMVYK